MSRGGGAGSSSERRKRSRAKAYSYLSYVDGELRRHDTWPACERRVSGKPNARFKKALSREDEEAIVRSWGLSVADLRRARS